jgi:hypothetical protein
MAASQINDALKRLLNDAGVAYTNYLGNVYRH